MTLDDTHNKKTDVEKKQGKYRLHSSHKVHDRYSNVARGWISIRMVHFYVSVSSFSLPFVRTSCCNEEEVVDYLAKGKAEKIKKKGESTRASAAIRTLITGFEDETERQALSWC